MSKTLDMVVTRYELQVGGVDGNPMGKFISLELLRGVSKEKARLYFYGFGDDKYWVDPFLGWRALLDHAFVMFMPRSDYEGHALLLTQTPSPWLRVVMDDDDDRMDAYFLTPSKITATEAMRVQLSEDLKGHEKALTGQWATLKLAAHVGGNRGK